MQIKNLTGVGMGLIMLWLAPTLVCAADADSGGTLLFQAPICMTYVRLSIVPS